MNPQLIKPIPKYIVNRIKQLDKINCPKQKGECRFYSYLTKIQGELVKITVAAKSFYRKWFCKQVAAHGVRSNECWVKDMEYKYFGGGYRVGWYAEKCSKKCRMRYERGDWLDSEFRYYNPLGTTTVNLEYIGRFPQYKYSAYEYYEGDCIIKYLRLYAKYPQTEYLLKLGLHSIHNSIMVLKLIAKDKQFCRWLITNKDDIAQNYYYVITIIRAYRTGKDITQIQALEQFKKQMVKDNGLKPIREMFRRDMGKFFEYITKQKTNPNTYLDYLNACNYLGLDMNIPKNRYPHNFNRWHDTRINEYRTAKAMADKKQRAELYKQFAAVAEKYLSLQHCKQGLYAVYIPQSPADLIREGKKLNHCVGYMDYDQKMINEETLIFFIRSADRPDEPFVTLEYSLKSKKVLQCYGNGNTKPEDTVLDFVNNVWLPYANRTVKKLNTQVA